MSSTLSYKIPIPTFLLEVIGWRVKRFLPPPPPLLSYSNEILQDWSENRWVSAEYQHFKQKRHAYVEEEETHTISG